jgi:hypothetical protein
VIAASYLAVFRADPKFLVSFDQYVAIGASESFQVRQSDSPTLNPLAAEQIHSMGMLHIFNARQSYCFHGDRLQSTFYYLAGGSLDFPLGQT